MMQDVKKQVAEALLSINAVVFTPERPITFKSGLRSPVYVDNRRIPYWPSQWQTVLRGFEAAIRTREIAFEVIAGIEAGGIPHSSALGYILQQPSVFVRKQAKTHGTRSQIEGGDVSGRRVLLVEDLVTTGGSSLRGVEALRADGAVVEDCLSIMSYGFVEAQEAFTAAGVRFASLTTLDALLDAAGRLGNLTPEAVAVIQDWLDDPAGWADRQGLSE